MRVYLDNCCYNRPFDEQGQLRVRLETAAKLEVQSMMRMGIVEYVWSGMLDAEVLASPVYDRIEKIRAWGDGASVYVSTTQEVRDASRRFMDMGLKAADAVHVACAVLSGCDWFLTVDRGVLSKMSSVGEMRVASPVEFIEEIET